jgi:hypothetical protein
LILPFPLSIVYDLTPSILFSVLAAFVPHCRSRSHGVLVSDGEELYLVFMVCRSKYSSGFRARQAVGYLAHGNKACGRPSGMERGGVAGGVEEWNVNVMARLLVSPG